MREKSEREGKTDGHENDIHLLTIHVYNVYNDIHLLIYAIQGAQRLIVTLGSWL